MFGISKKCFTFAPENKKNINFSLITNKKKVKDYECSTSG